MEDSVLQLVLQAGYVVRGVLIILLLFSIVSWAIIFFKHRYFSRANKETDQFLQTYGSNKNPKGLYQMTRNFTMSPIANVFRAVYTGGGNKDRGETKKLLRRYEALESTKLERYLSFLATVASTAPFIGLFGTVWGIMNSFIGIGVTGVASLAVVSPGIAEALLATAVGLAAAIPAVIAYNHYLGIARRMIIEMEDFSEELLDFFTKTKEDT